MDSSVLSRMTLHSFIDYCPYLFVEITISKLTHRFEFTYLQFCYWRLSNIRRPEQICSFSLKVYSTECETFPQTIFFINKSGLNAHQKLKYSLLNHLRCAVCTQKFFSSLLFDLKVQVVGDPVSNYYSDRNWNVAWVGFLLLHSIPQKRKKIQW